MIGKPDQQNMTVHRWFANKACPGDYLYNRHSEIAAEVNKRLGVADTEADAPTETEKPTSGAKALYKVQTGAFKNKLNATALQKKLDAAGFDTYLVNVGGLYKVQVGAYSVKANAEAMRKKLAAAGYADRRVHCIFERDGGGYRSRKQSPREQRRENLRRKEPCGVRL